jgi:hypothetical protein
MDISTHITALTTSYYFKVTTKTILTKELYGLYPGTWVKVPKISTPQHGPFSKWVYQLYNYLPTLTLTVSVQKKRIRYIKTSTIKSTALIYGIYPLLTEHYRVETLDQL